MNLSKRAFTVAVAVATILWSVGASALVAPLAASASTDLSNGDLIKGSLSTVYYYYGGERWTFPNEKTYMTWYENFDDVMTVSDSQLASYPLAGNITMRAGSWMVKIDTDPKTYVVTTDGEIRWVETEEVAVDLYGDSWNMWIMDVPDVFFTDYSEGASMMTAELVDGMLVESGSDTYLIWDGEKRSVSSAGMSANRLMDQFVITDSSVSLSDYSTGSSITSEVPALSDASQQATTTSTVDGGLTVSTSDDSPSGQTVPALATNVQLFGVDFEASGSDVTVSNLALHFTGVADTDVFSDLYLYANGERLTNGKSINGTTRTVTFTGLSVDVADGETETVWLTGDVAAEGFGTASVAFEIESEDSITSTAETTNGSFPVESEWNSLTDSASVGNVTIDETGSLSDVTLGEESAEIARFSISAEDEDAMIESLTLNVDKADDHSAYELWQSSTKIADGESIGSDLVLFTFDDAYTVLDGNSKTFKVTATIGGDPADTIVTTLEEASDLTAIGGDFGFGMEVINDMEDGSSVDIIGGKLTFAFNGPSASTDLQVGGDDQVIFDFTITSQSVATVNEIPFSIAMSDTGEEANFENFRIVNEDGVTVMGPEEIVADASPQVLTFDDEFDMEAGESMSLSLVVDINDTGSASDGDTIKATLVSADIAAEDADGDDLVSGTDIVPSASLTGNTLTLTDSSLTIDVAGTPSTGTVVKGSQNVDMVGFSFDAADASDVLVSSADFSILVEAASAGSEYEGDEDSPDFSADDYVTSCSLYNSDGDLVDGPEGINSDATVSFDGFQWTIAAGQTEKLVVNCDLANIDVNGTPDADQYAVRLDDVTAEDEDGDEIIATITEDNDDDGDQPETIITVAAAGSLTVELGSDSPDATIVIGGSADVEIATFQFNASTEAFNVDEITIDNAGDDAAVDSISLSYENADGETVTESGVFSSGSVTFDGLEMYVAADSTADLTVTVDTAAVSSSGADSGNTIVLTLDADTVQFTGISSGTTDTDAGEDADNVADTFELRKTKPTLSRASGSPSGSGFASLDEVLRFNVAADSHGYLDINELTFKLTSTDNNASLWNTCDGGDIVTADFSIYDEADLAVELEDGDADWTLFDSAGANCGDGNVITYVNVDFTDPVRVTAGSTKVYSLYADTTGASSQDEDSVRFDIPRQSDLDTAATGVDSINWEDYTEGSDVDGTYVKTLPLTGGTLVY